jgi:hypothetical protein
MISFAIVETAVSRWSSRLFDYLNALALPDRVWGWFIYPLIPTINSRQGMWITLEVLETLTRVTAYEYYLIINNNS